MFKKKKLVSLAVDKDFFDDIFERDRKKTMKQMGLNQLSQRQFTSMMRKNNI